MMLNMKSKGVRPDARMSASRAAVALLGVPFLRPPVFGRPGARGIYCLSISERLGRRAVIGFTPHMLVVSICRWILSAARLRDVFPRLRLRGWFEVFDEFPNRSRTRNSFLASV